MKNKTKEIKVELIPVHKEDFQKKKEIVQDLIARFILVSTHYYEEQKRSVVQSPRIKN